MLHALEKAPGSTHKRKIVGRGPGSTLGKTSGRGHKGQKSRSGSKSRIGFEGGQMPLHRRLPKRGFTSLFRKEYSIVNLGDIASCDKIDLTKEISLQVLIESGLVKDAKLPVKVLAQGTLDKSIKIEAHKFSSSAEKKIVEAGGTATVIDQK